MSNRLEELHAQYKKYYFKKYLKVFAGILVFIALGYMGYTYTQEAEVTLAESPIQNKLNKVEPKQVVQPKQRPTEYKLEVSADELDASMKKIKDAKVQVKPVYSSKKTVQKKDTTSKPKLQEERSRVNLFEGTQEKRSLESWIEKYNQKKSYAVAIYISKQYYFNKEFKQSGIWAKRANQLDRNKEEAWLYYAKSVYALGDTPKARRILNIFLQYKKSVKAELLLSEWSQ